MSSGLTGAAPPTVRAAAPEDAALILDITLKAWHGKVHPSSSVFRETVNDVTQQLAEGGGYVLYAAEAPAGSVRFSPVPGAWEVRRMGVLPEHRGLGLGFVLMNAVVAEAARRDVPELRLAVRHDQPRLIEFYASMGFALASEVEYAHANSASPPPTVMRRALARGGANVVKRLVVVGRVQGVGYRYSMMAQASRAGVTGWVRNRRDGTVEAMLAGPADKVGEVIAWAQQGPPGSQVAGVKVQDAEGSFRGFEMLATE